MRGGFPPRTLLATLILTASPAHAAHLPAQTIEIAQFGSVCDGNQVSAAKDTQAFQAAFAKAQEALGSGAASAVLKLPPGNCMLNSSLTLLTRTGEPVSIRGEGEEVSKVTFIDSASAGIGISANAPVQIADFTIAAGWTDHKVAGTALWIGKQINQEWAFPGVEINRLLVEQDGDGFFAVGTKLDSINISYTSDYTIRGLGEIQGRIIGFWIDNDGRISVEHHIARGYFKALPQGVGIKIGSGTPATGGNLQGVTVDEPSCTGVDTCIEWVNADGFRGNDMLTVKGGQFDTTSRGIHTSFLIHANIMNNYFLSGEPSDIALDLDNTSGIVADGNIFLGQGRAGPIAISLNSPGANAAITGNVFDAFLTPPIRLGPNAGGVMISGNFVTSHSPALVDNQSHQAGIGIGPNFYQGTMRFGLPAAR
jgi:hypothetical protein